MRVSVSVTSAMKPLSLTIWTAVGLTSGLLLLTSLADAVELTSRMQSEYSATGSLSCVQGEIVREAARPDDSWWSKLVGVQTFRCKDWRTRDALEMERKIRISPPQQ